MDEAGVQENACEERPIVIDRESHAERPIRVAIASRHDPKQPRRFIRIGGVEKSYEKPLGEWNQYEITCRGGAITVRVNGVLANETKDGSLKKGRIGFQAEGVEIEFKDIEIQKLKD